MSPAEKQRYRARSWGAVACVAATAVAMPAVAARVSYQVDQFALRERASLMVDYGVTTKMASTAEAVAPALSQISLEAMADRVEQRRRDMNALTGLASFHISHYRRAEQEVRERRCLAEAIYYEARSEGLKGQVAVAEVVLNRVESRFWPNSICGVVYEGSQRVTGCQFSFTCDGSMSSAPRGYAWEKAQAVAAHVLMELHAPVIGAATHYHTTEVNPVWAARLVPVSKVGAHLFYRFPRGQAERDVILARTVQPVVSADRPTPSY
jgi:spore germination cell wall hydrolase CwlJ-like protein